MQINATKFQSYIHFTIHSSVNTQALWFRQKFSKRSILLS